MFPSVERLSDAGKSSGIPSALAKFVPQSSFQKEAFRAAILPDVSSTKKFS